MLNKNKTQTSSSIWHLAVMLTSPCCHIPHPRGHISHPQGHIPHPCCHIPTHEATTLRLSSQGRGLKNWKNFCRRSFPLIKAWFGMLHEFKLLFLNRNIQETPNKTTYRMNDVYLANENDELGYTSHEYIDRYRWGFSDVFLDYLIIDQLQIHFCSVLHRQLASRGL